MATKRDAMLLDRLYRHQDPTESWAQWDKLYRHMSVYYPVGMCVDKTVVEVVKYDATGIEYVRRIRMLLDRVKNGKDDSICLLSESIFGFHPAASEELEEVHLRV